MRELTEHNMGRMLQSAMEHSFVPDHIKATPLQYARWLDTKYPSKPSLELAVSTYFAINHQVGVDTAV